MGRTARKYVPEVADAFCSSRLGTSYDGTFGTLTGGDLKTLLYLVQMGAIVIHAWFSRVDTLDAPDISLIDLDPGKGVDFTAVVKLARVVRSVTDGFGLRSAVKTSGSRGLHIGIPLPRGSDYDTSSALAARISPITRSSTR